MASPLPPQLQVQPDRGVIGIYGDHVDTFDPLLPHAPRDGIIESNGYESYLHTAQTLTRITLHFTPATEALDVLGHTTLDIPTGQLIISEITRGAHGPFALPDGPGLYRLTARSNPTDLNAAATTITNLISQAPTADEIGQICEHHTGAEQYWITLERVGDTTTDEDDEDA